MIRGLLYGLKKFWSEVFSGDLLILFLSIVLAVTSISSVGFLGDRLKSSMQMQASSILGADLVLRSASKIDSKISKEQKNSWWGTPMPIDSSHVIARMLWVKKNKPDAG